MLISSKTQRVHLRTSPAAKQMIQAAAHVQEKTVSEFLLDSGLALAAETLCRSAPVHSRRRAVGGVEAAPDAPPRSGHALPA